MAFIQWRRFDFFTHNFLDKKKDKASQKLSESKLLNINEQENGENLDTFSKLKKIKITCSDSGRGQIVLGDQNGWIHKLDNNFEMDSFQAFDYEVITVQQIVQNPYLITSGSDESNKNVIKIWNQNKIDPHKQMPTCIRTIKSGLNSINCRITCLKATDALTFMCICYNNGQLITIRGDILREKSCKQKKTELCKDEITGVFLRGNYQNLSNSFLNNRLIPLNLRQNKQVTSFITTNRQVYFFEMKNDQESWNVVEKDFGCTSGRSCCLINDGKHLDNCLFILGRKDAIYFYQNDGRGPCLAFANEKLLLHWFKGYLIVISKENLPFPANLTDSVVANSSNSNNMCTIYDIRNKYIAFSATFSSINQIFTEWGFIFILLNDGRLVQIREKDMNSKLELLFKKQQYSLAIELAKNQNFDSDNLTGIFKEYADHLYKKGDFENAINQYIKTIGKLEPSYVIKRYLDGQKVKNLTSYLYHLHKEGLANKDHTSLYLNCLTKSENTGDLINFLKNFDNKQQPANSLIKNQILDVQNAIGVLRKAKLYDQALYLCELFNSYDLYFKIQIEDKNNYLGAIQFIQTKLLNEKDLFFNQYFVKYSKLLFREKPAETTELLKRICENAITNASIDSTDEEKQKKSFFYIDILNSNPEKLIEFLEFLQEKNGEFKETIISNTLLELYLQNYRTTENEQIKHKYEDKILKLLKDDKMNYDVEWAMILCQVNKFTEGMKYLYEKLELYDVLILQCIECKDDQIIKICEKYGNRDHNLWVKAFLYFCKLNNSDNVIRETYLLRTIDELTKRKLLPLISITNLLSTNETLNLSMVKNYLINALGKENEIITENESLIKQYKDETDRVRKQIESIELNGKAFQSNKCSICNNFLDLPVVHFFCSHSFHQHCFQSHCGEDENNCPLCIQDQRKVLLLADLSQTIDNNELKDKFLNSINKSDSDSFSIVSNYFSKNLFNQYESN